MNRCYILFETSAVSVHTDTRLPPKLPKDEETFNLFEVAARKAFENALELFRKQMLEK